MKSKDNHKPWIVAHRGAMTEAPENTRAAFELAMASPVDGLEFDVQLTRDDVCVLHHDEDTKRLMGAKHRIAELDYASLSASVITLDEMLVEFGSRSRLLLEIKSFRQEKANGTVRRLTEHVLRTLQRHSSIEVFILSFDSDVLEQVSHEAQHHPCVLNTMNPREVIRNNYGTDYLFAYSTQIRKLDRELIEFSQTNDKRTMTWSCNTPGDVEKARDLGVDVIMTDRPSWISSYLREGTA